MAGAQDDVSQLMSTIVNGPQLYLTPEAIDYFAAKGVQIRPTPSTDKDAAVKSLRATINLAGKGPDARVAIGTLVEVFPRAVDVAIRPAEHYTSGQGRLEDWLQTYALSAKNKFLLSSKLIEYATASQCENFVETKVENRVVGSPTMYRGVMADATIDITVIITLNAAACALSSLSGQDLGTTQDAWRTWWAQQGGSFVPQAVSPSSNGAALSSGTELTDVVLKGKYRVVLATGDELVGTIEGLDDTSVVMESTPGPFKFNKTLVVEHQLLGLPAAMQAQPMAAGSGLPESQILTFAELQHGTPVGTKLLLRLASGKEFAGTLVSVTDDQLKLNIDGSEIPFSKDAVAQVSTVAGTKPEPTSAQTAPKAPQPLDTLYVVNPETDEYGKRLPDLMLQGKIVSDKNNMVAFVTSEGIKRSFTYGQITRRISHSEPSGMSEIERYGKPLFCPSGMVLVDVPPGKKGRPFFKVCIDAYEYPNKKGSVPVGNTSYAQAKKLCEGQGKRLCTTQEWQWACSGLEEYTYPYGSDLVAENCNAEGSQHLEPSATRYKCVSKFGASDMVGNIFEWVSGAAAAPMLMGGPLSKCQTQSPGVGGGAKPFTGFRCCKSN